MSIPTTTGQHWPPITSTQITSASGGMMPYYIDPAETFTIPEFRQGLYSDPIEIEGSLIVEGRLVEVD